MGFFTKTTKKITPRELTHEHVMSHFDSVLSHHSSSERDRRRAAFHTALNQAMDADRSMHYKENGGVTAEEFERIVTDLHKGGVITEQEAHGLRHAAEKPLQD